MVILITGRPRLSFTDDDVVLAHPADYTICTGAPAHHWYAEDDSTIISIRSVTEPTTSARS